MLCGWMWLYMGVAEVSLRGGMDTEQILAVVQLLIVCAPAWVNANLNRHAKRRITPICWREEIIWIDSVCLLSFSPFLLFDLIESWLPLGYSEMHSRYTFLYVCMPVFTFVCVSISQVYMRKTIYFQCTSRHVPFSLCQSLRPRDPRIASLVQLPRKYWTSPISWCSG